MTTAQFWSLIYFLNIDLYLLILDLPKLNWLTLCMLGKLLLNAKTCMVLQCLNVHRISCPIEVYLTLLVGVIDYRIFPSG